MARPSEAQYTRNILILTGAGLVSATFFELMFPTLAVTIASQMHLPLDRVLGWSFLGYLLYGLGALPAGWLADRISPRLLLVVAQFGLGVAALAVSEAPDGRNLSLCLAVMGLCASVHHPAAMGLISPSVERRGRLVGVNRACTGAAIVLTPLVTAALAEQLGWQQTYRAVGYTMCAVAVACSFLRVAERRSAAPAAPLPAPVRREAVWPFAVLVIAAVMGSVSYRGNMLVQPAFFADRVPAFAFGAVTSLVYLFGIAGQYVAGQLADRHDPRRLYLAFHAISLPALLLMTALSGVPLIGGAAVFVFFSLGAQPIEDRLFAGYAAPRWRAAAYGARRTLTIGVGALAVWLVQWSAAAGGLPYALLSLAGVLGLAVAAAALLSSRRGETSRLVVASAPADLLPERRPL